MEIVRKFLSASEVGSTSIRYDATCDCTQFTPDNGATWVDEPTLDPRTASAYQLPANPTSNPKCDASARVVAQMRGQINAVINAVSAAQAVALVLDTILIFVPGFGIIGEVIWLAIEALFFIGQSALDTSFTDAVYDKLTCLWLKYVGDDGIMTPAGLVSFQDDVAAAYPTDGVIAATISIMCDDFGLVQFNNAAVMRTETGDCVACATHCLMIDFTVTDGSEYGVSNLFSNGTWVSGTGWVAVYSGTFYDITIGWDFPAVVNAQDFEMWFTKTAGHGRNDVNHTSGVNPYAGYLNNVVVYDYDNPKGTDIIKHWHIAGVNLDGIIEDINDGFGDSGGIIISQYVLYYDGDIPSGWSDNCG